MISREITPILDVMLPTSCYQHAIFYLNHKKKYNVTANDLKEVLIHSQQYYKRFEMSSNYMALVVEEKIALQYRLQISMSPFRHVTNFSISIHILKVIQPI